MEITLTIFLFLALVSSALAITRVKSIFAAIMLSGTFSMLSALLFITMDAVDVALTEAAVGAGVTSVLMLSTMALIKKDEKQKKFSIIPLIVVLVTGAGLIYGTVDMPNFGDPFAPVHTNEGVNYIERTPFDIHVPNVVTAVLGSYRGYDTLGEAIVIFTAGLGVIILIGGQMRHRTQRRTQSKRKRKK